MRTLIFLYLLFEQQRIQGMKRSEIKRRPPWCQFSESQIVAILKEGETDVASTAT
jgi:hypothetical protein